MAPEQKELLGLRSLPARLTVGQAAHVLGFNAHDLPILTAHGLLKPLATPPPNGVKFYAAAEIERLKTDVQWLGRATACLYRYWQAKNRRRTCPRHRSVSPTMRSRDVYTGSAATD